MNHLAFAHGDYMQSFVQVILFQFLHGNMMHLLANTYFLYTAGPMVESRMSRDRFLWFFMGTTVFLAICLHLFSPWSVTIGISGLCMALLSYLWIDLYTAKHPMANQILIMLALNIGLGFVGNISFVGHFFGAVFGLIWWYFRKKG
jgi:membrane associated rhomboid family serine protease